MNLIESIRLKIKEKGPLPFVDYMQLALYSPNLGYYSSSMPKFGRSGDFITAPELSPLFGKTLANQAKQILEHLNRPTILEFGAGTGRLAVDILRQLEKLQSLPERYLILELSAALQNRQKNLIQQEIPHLADKVDWLSHLPEQPFSGLLIANEVLDAMPVHRFLQSKDGLLESYIGLDEALNLTEIYKPCTHENLKMHIAEVLNPTFYPYQSEANLFLKAWFKSCFEMLNKGVLLVIDYGFPRHEYYHPDRNQGTLVCHYQHTCHSNPLAHPGEEDITAHVDFTEAAYAADAAGFHVTGYSNQASFLLSNGLLSLLQEIPEGVEQVKAKQAVKQLLHENEMGELFKVLGLSKNLDLDLTGFQLQDKRASL